jgi:hypothetical protein
MGSTSELVVQGTVQAVRSVWNAKHTRILTEVDVSIAQQWKGQAPATVRVVQWGGTVGDVKMTVAGAPQWRAGEELVLFLERAGELGYRVAGFSQGRFVVEHDEITGETYLRRPPLAGVELFAADGHSKLEDAGAAQRLGLQELLAEALPELSEGR